MTAEQLGGGRFRLRGLVRGCRGTDWATAEYLAGTPFCMLDTAAMVPVATEVGLIGQTVVATAFGIGDRDPHPTAQLQIFGDSISRTQPTEVMAPSGGDVIDDEARTTIEAILAVLAENGLTTA